DHRAGRGRLQHHLLHHRPRLRVRGEAGALHQAGDEQPRVSPHGGRHGHQLRRDPRGRAAARGRAADLRGDHRGGVRQAQQERALRRGRGGVRSVDHRPGDVETGLFTSEALKEISMAGRPAMYRGDRRRKEDQRKAKQEAKRARKAERKESGVSGPEIDEVASPTGETTTEYVWFSPSKARTVTTESSSPPVVPGIEDWTLVSEPPRREG